jgi:hypothetical protein
MAPGATILVLRFTHAGEDGCQYGAWLSERQLTVLKTREDNECKTATINGSPHALLIAFVHSITRRTGEAMLRKPTRVSRILIAFLLSSFIFVTVTQPAEAAIITTEQIAAANSAQQNRQTISAALARPEVIAQLAEFGVDQQQAQARVAALTDEQAAAMAHEINQMPAGGDWAWAGWLLGIFLILVITDLIGWTHIFPFTKSKAKR